MEKINVESKSNQFKSIMDTQFQGKINLARLKLIAMFVFALCEIQTVSAEKLTNAFDTWALAASSSRRIKYFMTSCALDSVLVAKQLFCFLPCKKNLKLSIDCTNWKFSQTDKYLYSGSGL